MILREYIRSLLKEQEEEIQLPTVGKLWVVYETYKNKYHWPDNLTRDSIAILRSIATSEVFSTILGIADRATYRLLVEDHDLVYKDEDGVMRLTGRGDELYRHIVHLIGRHEVEDNYRQNRYSLEPGEEQ